MKLWLLRPREPGDGAVTEDNNPWDPWYDKCFGFVVRAKTEIEARQFAHESAGAENRGEFMYQAIANTKEPWLDPAYSTCVECTA